MILATAEHQNLLSLEHTGFHILYQAYVTKPSSDLKTSTVKQSEFCNKSSVKINLFKYNDNN